MRIDVPTTPTPLPPSVSPQGAPLVSPHGIQQGRDNTGGGRELVPLNRPPPALVGGTEIARSDEVTETTRPASVRREFGGDTDTHNASPREMVEFSLDLYVSGVISYDDYAVLAFQPELHPDYNKTIGALTGEPAQPDRKRDHVALWDEQLQFELRHGSGDAAAVRQAERIRDVLKQIADPTEIEA